MSLKLAKLDISSYLMEYYNFQRPHSFNHGLAAAIAEEILIQRPILVDHYTFNKFICQIIFLVILGSYAHIR